MKTKFDILFEQIMSENSLQSGLEKSAEELPVEGQDKIVEEFNERLAAVKTAISYPWLKEPYEGIYKELSKYNNEITRYKNDEQLLMQIGYTVCQILGGNPANPFVVKRNQNKVTLSIWNDCNTKTEEIKDKVKEYPWFKLSYNVICLNYVYKKDASTVYIPWLEKVLSETKKLVKTIGDIPKWCDIEKYSEAIEALKIKKESDEIWVNTTEITDEIRDEYFIDYGYANSWGQDDRDKFSMAYILHQRDRKDHPELHNTRRKQNARSDETIYCSCGFKHSADSSD